MTSHNFKSVNIAPAYISTNSLIVPRLSLDNYIKSIFFFFHKKIRKIMLKSTEKKNLQIVRENSGGNPDYALFPDVSPIKKFKHET